MERKRLGVDGWSSHLEAFRGSGLSLLAYCKQEGLSYQTAIYWRKKLRGQSGFREIDTSGLSVLIDGSSDAEIVLPSGIQIRLKAPSPETLSRLIRELMTLK